MSALAFMVWCYLFGTSNSDFIFVNKDGDNSKLNLKRMRNLIDRLPEYMQSKQVLEEDGKYTKAKENVTSISNPVNENSVTTKAKATSRESALSLARGLTSNVIHFDSVNIK